MKKKILRYLLCIVVFLVLLSGAAVIAVATSNSALKQAIALVNATTDYTIRAQRIEGTLLSDLDVSHLQITGEGLSVSSEHVAFDIRERDLWQRKLAVQYITLKNTHITTPAKHDEPLSDVILSLEHVRALLDWVSIDVTTLEIDNLSIQQGNGTPTVIDSVQASASNNRDSIDFKHVSFSGLGITAKISGTIGKHTSYPVDLQAAMKVEGTPMGSVTLALTASGNLAEQLTLALHTVSGPSASINAVINTLLTDPTMTASIDLDGVPAVVIGLGDGRMYGELTIDAQLPQLSNLSSGLMSVASDAKIRYQQNTGELLWSLEHAATVTGSINDYTVSVHGSAHNPEIGALPFELTAHGDQQALTDIVSQITLRENPVAITGDVRWSPVLTYTAQIGSDIIPAIAAIPQLGQVDLTVRGKETAYNAQGSLRLNDARFPHGKVNIEVTGNSTHLDSADIAIATLGGEITARSQGALSPVALTSTIAMKHIQPQQFYKDIVGDISTSINMKIENTGDDNPSLLVSAVLGELTGNIQDYPLSGSGSLLYNIGSGVLIADRLEVDVAGNIITAHGSAKLPNGNHSHKTMPQVLQEHDEKLNITVAAEHLNRIARGLSGNVHLRVDAQGDVDAPLLKVALKGNDLRYQDITVKSFVASGALNSRDESIRADADAQHLSLLGKKINNVRVNVDGQINYHTLSFDVISDDEVLPHIALRVQGQRDSLKEQWSAEISRLTVKNALVGDWQLRTPAHMQISDNYRALRSLCLYQQLASICVQATNENGQSSAKLAMKQLPAALLRDYIPETFALETSFSGDVNGHWQGSQDPRIEGSVHADAGTLTILSSGNKFISQIQQFSAGFLLENNNLSAEATGDVEHIGAMSSTLKMPDLDSKQLVAEASIASNDLSFVDRIVPQVSKVSGAIRGNVNITGSTNGGFHTAATVTLDDGALSVQKTGTHVSNLKASVVTNPQGELVMDAKAQLGGGTVMVTGTVDALAQRGVIYVKGNKARVAHTGKIDVFVTPDITITLDETIIAEGTITVPSANITYVSSTSRVSVSDDVILPNQKKKSLSNSPIDANITIQLGDDVVVRSSDVTTRLHGALKIISKTGGVPRAAGEITVDKGKVTIYGQTLDIDRGRAIFGNGPITNPSLDIRASRTIEDEDITVGANVLGTASKPSISLFSSPPMADPAVLSYLLFGRPPNNDSFSMAALLQTSGAIGVNQLGSQLRAATGLDVLNIGLTSFEAGKNLSRKFYVGMYSNFFEVVNTFIMKWRFNKTLRLEATSDSDDYSIDLIKSFETD